MICLFIKIQNFMEQNSFYTFLHFPRSLQVTEYLNRQGETSKILKNIGNFFEFNKL